MLFFDVLILLQEKRERERERERESFVRSTNSILEKGKDKNV